MAIAYNNRWYITGGTGSGKSTFARRLFLSAPAPRLVIDPADSTLTATPGAVTFTDPAAYPLDAATARYVPADPDDRDAYDAVYATAFSNGPRLVWCDEAGQVLPAQRYPRRGNAFLVQGRKRQLGHITCHTRPREVARNAIAQADHLVVFGRLLPDDARHVAELAGLPPAELETALAQLPRYGFAWWDRAEQVVRICPPLDG